MCAATHAHIGYCQSGNASSTQPTSCKLPPCLLLPSRCSTAAPAPVLPDPGLAPPHQPHLAGPLGRFLALVHGRQRHAHDVIAGLGLVAARVARALVSNGYVQEEGRGAWPVSISGVCGFGARREKRQAALHMPDNGKGCQAIPALLAS